MEADPYKEIKRVGKGVFGTVTLVKRREDETFLAKKTVTDVIDILIGVREADVLTFIRDRADTAGTVLCRDFQMHVDEANYTSHLYLDYCPGGSLEDSLNVEAKDPTQGLRNPLGTPARRIIDLARILGDLGAMADHGIYHLDIKTENILYRRDERGEPQMALCDFSNSISHSEWKRRLGVGLPPVPLEAVMYRPPEVAMLATDWEVLSRVDAWAFGIMIIETLGGWDAIHEIENRVHRTMGRILDAVGRVDAVRNHHAKKTRERKRVTPAAHTLLGDRVFRPELGKTFASTFLDTSSQSQDLVWCILFCQEVSRIDFAELHETCVSYFRLRGHRMAETEGRWLKTLFAEILPRMLTFLPRDRWTVQQAAAALTELTGSSRRINQHPREEPDHTTGPWSILPDECWKGVVSRYLESIHGRDIDYGFRRAPCPLAHPLLAKRYAELVITRVGEIPSAPEERIRYYRNVLGACTFLASEHLDFVFPFSDVTWFDDLPLEELAPYLELAAKILVGELTTQVPTTAEIEAVESDRWYLP